MGFEVLNSTAEIYMQGQATVWRQPNRPTPSTLSYSVATTPPTVGTLPGFINRFPPGTLGDAQLLYGSRSWKAAEGCYVVSRQCDAENPFSRPDYIPDFYSVLDSTHGANGLVYTPNAPGIAQKLLDIHAPFDISGVHFTGLSNQTSLTINVRWLIERSPSPTETDLVVMATPSASYDPLALELYCQCLVHMPPGVMQKENGLGDWFRNAMSGLEKWAPKIGDALSVIVPGAGVVGSLVGKASGLASQIGAKKQQPKKQPLQGSASTAGRN
jgi:hypothetical protein